MKSPDRDAAELVCRHIIAGSSGGLPLGQAVVNIVSLASELATSRRRVEEMERDCSEAYQVVAVLAGDLFTHPDVQRALDNLSDASNGLPRSHDDLLPFPKTPLSSASALAEMEQALTHCIALIDGAMADNGDDGADMELTPNGGYMLSDARALLSPPTRKE